MRTTNVLSVEPWAACSCPLSPHRSIPLTGNSYSNWTRGWAYSDLFSCRGNRTPRVLTYIGRKGALDSALRFCALKYRCMYTLSQTYPWKFLVCLYHYHPVMMFLCFLSAWSLPRDNSLAHSWWLSSLILALGRQRYVDTSLAYITNITKQNKKPKQQWKSKPRTHVLAGNLLGGEVER